MAPQAPLSLVIFDCDGVLVDSERLSHQVLLEMLGEHGVQMTFDEAIERFMGNSEARTFDLICELVGSTAPADFMSRLRERTFAAFSASLEPVPGARDVLGVLAERAHPFCVASNGPREKMRFTLGHTGLLPLLDGRLFSAQDVARPKPAPDLFLHAAATLGASAARCVVVEDSPTGVAAARAAGMAVFGFAAMGEGQARKLHAAGAERVFDDMARLPQLLRAMN